MMKQKQPNYKYYWSEERLNSEQEQSPVVGDMLGVINYPSVTLHQPDLALDMTDVLTSERPDPGHVLTGGPTRWWSSSPDKSYIQAKIAIIRYICF